jgi:hypothetical protein
LTWRNRFVRGRWEKSAGTMRIGAVARQPKMAEGASLFRPTLTVTAWVILYHLSGFMGRFDATSDLSKPTSLYCRKCFMPT